MPKKKEQTQPELCKDIVHIVNVMICEARDGGYETPKMEKLYDQFDRMIKRLKVAHLPEEQLVERLEKTEAILNHAAEVLWPTDPELVKYRKQDFKRLLKEWDSQGNRHNFRLN